MKTNITDINQDYISDNVQRTLSVVNLLCGHEIEGLSTSDIAKGCEATPASICRAIANLRVIGWIEPLPTNERHYRLSPALVQMANTVALSFSKAQQMLSQDQHNFSRIA